MGEVFEPRHGGLSFCFIDAELLALTLDTINNLGIKTWGLGIRLFLSPESYHSSEGWPSSSPGTLIPEERK